MTWRKGLAIGLAGGMLAAPAAAESLGAALQAALSRHPALAAKRAEVEAKGHLGDSVRAQRYPSLSAQLAAQDSTPSNPGSLRARQPVWAFGRIDSAIAYADADLSSEQADHLRLRRQLTEQTGVAYARMLGARQRLVIAEKNVASLQRFHEKIGRREQGQMASMADVRLALARLTQARAQQERYSGELLLAGTDLRALTQMPLEADQPVPASVVELPGAAEVEALAERESAEVRRKAALAALAEAEAERERTASRPTVYLQADRPLNQPGYLNEVRVGVMLEASLDGMGMVASGRTRAAGSRRQAAADDLAAARVELARNVGSLWANRNLQRTLAETQAGSVAELTEILASYQRQYEAGQKSWLDVLNMQRELYEQQLAQVQAENDWLIHSLKLAALIGRLDALADAAPGVNRHE